MHKLTSFVVVGVLAATVSAQQVVPPGPVVSARISPTLYFPSSAAELTSRNVLHARVAALLKELGDADIELLPRLLDTANQVLTQLQRHAAYLKVQTLEDTQDQGAKASAAAVSTDRSVIVAATTSRLRRVPADQMSFLGHYALLAQQAQRDAAHAFSPDAEQYRGAVTGPLEDAIGNDYNRLFASLVSNWKVSSLDTAVRRAAIEKRNEAYDQAAPVAATMLAALIDLENRDAVAQGYINAADRKYSSLGLNSKLVEQTLEAVQAEAPTYRHYEQVLAEHTAHKLRLPSVLSTEQDLGYTPAPQIPLEQGQQLILDGLGPLGPDYSRRFAELLDPRNGRLDLSGGPHRGHTGTSIDAYDAPVALYFEGYDSSLKTVSTVAHEGGHAIHRELMNTSGMPFYQRTGPHYMFEGFALFNELLLLDHAVQVATTPAQREYALERLLWKVSVELFISAEETALEQGLYTTASGHALLDRAGIDAIYRGSISPYEYWSMSDVGASRGWMRKSLLFEDPLYLVNYLYAAVVAVALYDRSHTDPNFAAKYEALLKRGFDADAQTLLASIGIRLDDPGLVKAVAKLLETRTEELQRLYRAELSSK